MTLPELNEAPVSELKAALTACCGSSAWVKDMVKLFPVDSRETLFEQAEMIWFACSEADWKEAFAHHPKIGDIGSLRSKFASTRNWASGEQSGVAEASEEILRRLAEGNRLYEEKFGYIFIVCATGKSASEMLNILESRLPHSPEKEIQIAMQEQNKITKIRLEKLLGT
ncbi:MULTISPECIES: 2-oxo-4-hydroxy-4-carboxy-5-ureidoimidazoline decarboxylase [unclassified Spirosoma]|uniref:2-oxo-4-hydroxy-4-carboxy-5-ureidoimidazoline decarboxylase n=1 Tax=unclassified Spirosoma TaxID=2621999 RepID=UPI00095E0428|nr:MULTISPECIES: 2-oxo-4-hydroxy-4-carboxy-5-ureidoimidazoline decarboxylase [unclassified Spirosoma]MBN8825595.1 2-oxo-4-hydroxy-4-carboxy-5-ureidoimidazoline decarboxylase [Spirosoma sp.]OJW71700.1 MAG: OHCU decarboxylase [Spirosoma sp. 48-14]